MKHRPRKRFGQNFLHDPATISRIVAAINPCSRDHLLEIGPGHGALTRPLTVSGARITVIEIDRDLVAGMRADPDFADLEIIEADALKANLGAIVGTRPARLLGNLPYNLSTPLLFHALGFLANIVDMHFLLQREVVERMAAQPGSKTYGRLSVSLQYHCRVEPLFVVKCGAFWPVPKVESMLVRLRPLIAPQPRAADSEVFARVLVTAFAQRRKQLHNSLDDLLSSAELSRLGIPPEVRPENLAVADFVRIANHVAAERQKRAISH